MLLLSVGLRDMLVSMMLGKLWVSRKKTSSISKNKPTSSYKLKKTFLCETRKKKGGNFCEPIIMGKNNLILKYDFPILLRWMTLQQ
jgi:hypothetical protein